MKVGPDGHSVLRSAFLGALAQRHVAGHRDQEFWHAFRLRVLGVKIQTHKMPESQSTDFIPSCWRRMHHEKSPLQATCSSFYHFVY